MKLNHLTIAVSVAIGLAACGGSDSNNNAVDNSGGAGSGNNPGAGNNTDVIPVPEEPSDGPDVVKEADRQAPSMTPEARFVGDIAAQKALYTGSNDRQSLGGFQDFSATNTLPNAPYADGSSNQNSGNLVETHYVQGTTKVGDALRSGAIYNYVQAGHVVGTGLFSTGTGVASSNPGAVVADPGFTYAQGSDGRYYRMQPVGANWNSVSASTRYAPVDSNFNSQFSGGTVGQSALVFIPNAREFKGQLVTDVTNIVGNSQQTTGALANQRVLVDTTGPAAYNYRSTGLPSIDGRGVAGGVDAINIASNEDNHVFEIDNFQVQDGANNVLSNITLAAVPDRVYTADLHRDRRTFVAGLGAALASAPRNTYIGMATGFDPAGNQIFTVIPSTNSVNNAGINLNAFEAGALVSIQQNATSAPTDFIQQVTPVTLTADGSGNIQIPAGVNLINENDNTVFSANSTLRGFTPGSSVTVNAYRDTNNNVVYTQGVRYTAASATGAPAVLAPTTNVYWPAANKLLQFSDFPALLAFDNNPATLADTTVAARNVTNGLLSAAVTSFAPVITGNAFDTNRGVVEWQHLTMLGNDYDLASNVTSKVNALDFSSLKVAKEIQDVPLTVTYLTKGTKGTQSTGDDKSETQTVEAGMLKVYNLPYHRSFVNINQDAVDNNPRNRGFYDAFNLATDGIGNGRYGALHVTGVETQGVPWNGRAEYTGSSYGIYTDGQYVKGDIELSADFAKDRASVSGTVKNRTLADGSTAPDMALQRIPLIGSTGTQNYDTGTRAMSAANQTLSGAVTIGGVQNAGIWDFQLYGPNAEEIGGLIKYGQAAPITGQLQPDAPATFVNPLNAAGNRTGGYNEVFSAQRKDISVTSNQSQIPTK